MINKDKMMRIKIIDDLLSRKLYPSKKEIIQTIEKKLLDLYGDQKKASISPSSIEKDIKDMRYNSAMFAETAEIIYDKKNKGYYYNNDDPNFSILKNQLTPNQKADIEILLSYFKDSPLFDHMRDSIDNILATIYTTEEEQQKIIQFDRAVYYEGSKYLPIITKSIKENQKLKFDYNKTFSGNISEKIVEPYFLKEFEKRWYLIAYSEKDKGIRIYELSRISELEVLEDLFVLRSNLFNPDEYYKNVFGVFTTKDNTLTEFILKFDREEGRLIETLKIHSSQEKVEETDTHITFRYQLQYNENSFEMMRLVSKFSNNVQVVKPESLKQEIIKRFKETLKNYEE